ncbi:heterokaryon incompatibility protein-domain-containing protein [Cercophora scortea]|uniref:Heterokaryon incompatibility protein-domain-containing protein n=1 Tax=Cercophora scortea TaxID=314031 RepID=A0AAE0IWV0_9PEZI|nr:heterokaryon incompatibility protein-domain-containing protein [Cercophora scortea]
MAFQYPTLENDGQFSFRVMSILPDIYDAPIRCILRSVPFPAQAILQPQLPNLPSPDAIQSHTTHHQDRQSRLKRQRLLGAETWASTTALWRKIKPSRGRDELILPPAEPIEEAPEHQNQHVPYEAVSYAWGDEPHDQRILLNGRPFLVSLTLKQAIGRLRREDRPREVWIDAICIDQHNPREKANQIRQMHHIFAGAEQVVVWLGEAEGVDCELAFDFVRQVSRGVDLDRDGHIPLPLSSSVECLMARGYLPSWSAFYQLISRSWWRRAWVVQELLLAQSAVVLCGSASIRWNHLETGIALIYPTYEWYLDNCQSEANLKYFRLDFLSFFLCNYFNLDAAIGLGPSRFRYIRSRTDKHPSSHILNWLNDNRIRLCKFGHDRIYSILALTPKSFSDSIRIDYQQTVEELFKSVVRSFVNTWGSLDIILFSHHSAWHRHSQLPSWVPDWRRSNRTQAYGYNQRDGLKRAHAIFSPDMSHLTVNGAELAHVLETQVECDLMPNLTKTNSFVGPRGKPFPNGDGKSWWVMELDELEDIFQPAMEQWSAGEIFSVYPFGSLNVFLKLLSRKQRPESFDPEWYLKTGYRLYDPNRRALWNESHWKILVEELRQYLVSRTVVATTSFLAVAPDTAQEGDVIFWIQGCSALVLLRPTGDGTFTFIGDVFVGSERHGHDDFIEGIERDNDESTLREITLV